MLDEMNKKRIQVWINSPGGIVMDGYNIYNAILKTKTKVDTFVVGIAASIAAVIFQAGRKRIMSEYGLLMYHNPYGGNSDELKKMKVSIAIMIASRTGKSQDEILKMMDRTTWITADEAIQTGFCDEVEKSEEFNKKRTATEPKAMWKESSLILNSILKPKNIKMTKVANKLGLNPDASEESIIAEVSAIMNKKAEADDKLKKMEDRMKKMEDDLDEYKAKYSEEKKKAEEADEDKKKSEAKNMVEGFAKAGKIKIEAVNKWMDMAAKDFEGTKSLLEELPVSKVANKIQTPEGSTSNEAELTMVIARTMNDVRNKYKL